MEQKVAFEIFSQTIDFLKNNVKNKYTVQLVLRDNNYFIEISIKRKTQTSSFFVITRADTKERVFKMVMEFEAIKRTPLALFEKHVICMLNKEVFVLDGEKPFTIKSISKEDGVYMCLLSDEQTYSIYDLNIKEGN